MRLAEFILANIEPILVEWEAFARSLLPGKHMTINALRDDAASILLATVGDMQNLQSLEQQESKSKGNGDSGSVTSDRLDDASELHGMERVSAGFHITEVIAEYRALRASVLRLWRESIPEPHMSDLDDVTRFDESLDQSLAGGVGSYSKRIDESRQMFLAILSHDLRNPLSCIQMAAQVVSMEIQDTDTAQAMSIVKRNADEMLQLVSDLIDFSSSGLGRAMPLNPAPFNLEQLCWEVLESFRTAHPGRKLCLQRDGDVNGIWDAGRIRQVVSNLVGNAIQHGPIEGTINLSITTNGMGPEVDHEGQMVVLSVHNGGEPIPAEYLPTIFDPLKRYATMEPTSQRNQGSVGLGLYIVREIAIATGGKVMVTSTAHEGTTFTVHLPRVPPTKHDNQNQLQLTK